MFYFCAANWIKFFMMEEWLEQQENDNKQTTPLENQLFSAALEMHFSTNY